MIEALLWPAGIAARTGAHEVVSEGVNGLLYEPGSDEGLVAAVRRLLEDETTRRSFGLRHGPRPRSATGRLDCYARGYYEEALDFGSSNFGAL